MEKYWPDCCYWLCHYSGIRVWKSYMSRCWFLNFSFLGENFVFYSAFFLYFQAMRCLYVACFSGLLCWCVHRKYLLVLEAGILRWAGGRKVGGGGFGSGVDQSGKKEIIAVSCYRSGNWTPGAAEGVWLCLQPTWEERTFY